MKKWIYKKAFLFFLFTSLQAQQETLRPDFKFLPLFFRHSEDQTRVELHFRTNRLNLIFKSSDKNYVAKLDLNLYVYSGNKLLVHESHDTAITLSSYDETTIDTTVELKQLNILLPPGKFKFLAKLFDRNSSKESKVETLMVVPRFGAGSDWISSIILGSVSKDGKPQILLDNRFSPDNGMLYYYAEIYYLPSDENITGTVSLYNNKTRFYKLNEKITSNTISGTIPVDSLESGPYTLKITLSDAHTSYSKETTLFIVWSPLAWFETDLNGSLELLSYIGSNDEIDSIRKAPKEERRKKFENFWRKRDPTPNTAKNEAMDEFYERVKYANEHFTGIRDGWRTDMGRVYIIYGPPDEIERHPFELGSAPYEIWYYYAERKKFIFIDKNQNGEYELYNPVR